MALDITTARADVAKLYIAAFDRVPDSTGLDFWVSSYMAGTDTLETISQKFTNSTEYKTAYPSYLTTAEYVEKIYVNVFNRASDTDGKAFWVAKLADGSLTTGTLLKAMVDAAAANSSTDGAMLANQAAFGVYAAVNEVPFATANAQLSSITSVASTLTAAEAAIAGSIGTVAGETFTLTKNVDTFNGTNGNDTFVANYDAQATAAHTLGGLDTLNGGAGTDTLAITSTSGAGFTLAGATISSIETMTIRGDNAITADVSGSNVAGLTSLNVTQAAGAVALTAGATTDINVSGDVHATATIATTGGKTVTVNHKLDSAGDAISVNGAVNVNVTATDVINAAGIDIGTTTANTGTVVVNASGAAVTSTTATHAMDAIAVTGGTTITVNQDATSNMGTIATVPLAGAATITQGAVTVVAGNTTTEVTVTQDDQATAANAVAAVAAVKQTQTVTFNALVAGNSVTVNGLTFTATKSLTAAEVAAAFADLTSEDRQDNGGPVANGIYTGINTAGTFTTGAAVGNTVVYTEVTANTNADALVPTTAQGTGLTAPTAPTAVVSNAGSAAVTAVTGVLGVANGAVLIDDNAVKSITTVTVDGYSAGATIGGVSALDAITTLTLKNSGAGAALLHTGSTGALTLNLVDVDGTVSVDGTAATITNLTINTSGVASTGAITAAAATTVTINAEAALSGASTFTAATLIDVNGSAAVDLTGAITNAATLATIDASGNTGGVKVVLSGTNSVKFTGGTGNDSLTLATAGVALGKDVDMGAGDDTLTIGVGTTAANILTATALTGGAGTDTLAMTDADAVANSANTAFTAKISGFEYLTINNAAEDNSGTATTQTVNLGNLGFNYITVQGTKDAGAAVYDTLALTGAASGTTINFTATTAVASATTYAASDLYTLALADATGTADVMNISMKTTVGDNLVNGVDVANQTGSNMTLGTVTANAIETFNVSSNVADVDGGTNSITLNGDSVKTINVTGNATTSLTSTNITTLKTIDASASTGGITFTAASASMTIKGGAGADNITIGADADSGTFYGNGGNDTFHITAGADLVTIDGGTGVDTFDFNGASTNKSNFVVLNNVGSGDKLDFAGIVDGSPATTFNSAKITLSVGATESTQAYLDQAMTVLAENGFGWFQYNGNTYIAADVGTADSANSFVDGSDFVVMISGLVDLSTASFNATGVLEIA